MASKSFIDFIKSESTGGILLMIAALAALLISNSNLSGDYFALQEIPGTVTIGNDWLVLSKPLLIWVNDLWMAIFFCLVGLEIKREFKEGDLSTPAQARLPILCAIGGMVMPALIYGAINYNNPVGATGWAIPAATDIAFALGILTLMGSKVPISLKIFLTAVAIIDDLGAIVIIALFYTSDLNWMMLLGAAVCTIILYLLNKSDVAYVSVYAVVGSILWLFVLKSGVHATLAGVVTAFAIPMYDKAGNSPLKSTEHSLHPWVSYLILPLFAFLNAGISFAGVTVQTLQSTITIGVAIGLIWGKTLGIFGTMWLLVKFKLAQWPKGATELQCFGISVLCGIGFTMSLFIGGLAFESSPELMNMVKVGVLAGSLVSALVAIGILTYAQNRPVTHGNPQNRTRSQRRFRTLK